jgi:protein-disulfide isomerase
MLCLLALITSAVLAAFSARYRPLAREAIECVLRRVTLRKCTTGFDKQVKAAVAGKLMRTHPRTAKLMYRHMELLAWLFVAITTATAAYLGYGFYNYYHYGNCYGPVAKGFCIFDPSGTHSKYSGILTRYRGPKIVPDAGGAPSVGPENAAVTVIEFGSYTCPYTRRSDAVVRELLRRRDGSVRFVYRQFPLDGLEATANTNQGMCADAPAHGTPTPASAVTESADVHAGAGRTAIAAYCARTQGRFWEYHRLLCSRPDAAATCDGLVALAREALVDDKRFVECLDDPAAHAAVQTDFEAGVRAGLYGTPTFFVNGVELVAPSKEVLDRAITRALEKSRP